MRNFLRKRKYRDYEINPDEIFIDDVNVSDLNQQQFEGVIEQPITHRTLVWLGIFFVIIFIIFFGRLIFLQVVQGQTFLDRSENNRLRNIPMFAERGVIYDRNNVEIAWNSEGENSEAYSLRSYTKLSGHGHLLGYINYPQKDNNGNFWRKSIEGLAGIEKKYNERLSGTNGAKLIEVDALGKEISNNTISTPEAGENIITTIDSRIQHAMYEAIKSQAEVSSFEGGAASIMDIHTGELIAFTSYPEFDPYTLAAGKDVEAIQGFFNDPQKPFLNRVLSGLYSPGSIIKPFLGLAALHENLITENTTILSTGRIEVPNIYNPSNPSVFVDWRPKGHGVTDIRHAIADSVNTFFYAIGGGYKNQKGLGINNIDKYVHLFGISEPTGIDFGVESTGVIPNPEWKAKAFKDGTWRLGDTYNTSIGQFGFQVTPIQMTRAVAALANDGILLTPLLVKGPPEKKPIEESISPSDYAVIRDALRETVTKGTAVSVNVPYVSIAAKTGTAQVGVDNEFYNSWIMGFFPYENPQYAFSIVMERAPEDNVGSAGRAMKTFIESVQQEYPKFWEDVNNK